MGKVFLSRTSGTEQPVKKGENNEKDFCDSGCFPDDALPRWQAAPPPPSANPPPRTRRLPPPGTPASEAAPSEAPASDFDASNPISVISREPGSGTRGAFIELFGIEEKGEDGTKVDRTTEEATIANQTNVVMDDRCRAIPTRSATSRWAPSTTPSRL